MKDFNFFTCHSLKSICSRNLKHRTFWALTTNSSCCWPKTAETCVLSTSMDAGGWRTKELLHLLKMVCSAKSELGKWKNIRDCKRFNFRGTGCTDKSLYRLAQHCPDIEWIAHSDFSGRPKFSEKALQCLRESCKSIYLCFNNQNFQAFNVLFANLTNICKSPVWCKSFAYFSGKFLQHTSAWKSIFSCVNKFVKTQSFTVKTERKYQYDKQ